MNYYGYPYQWNYCGNNPMYNNVRTQNYWSYPFPIRAVDDFNAHYNSHTSNGAWLRDYGGNPFVVNINDATKGNNTFRTALWTGEHLQLTLMSLNPGEEIGLEMHPNVDQFLRIEQGEGIVQMGETKDRLNFRSSVHDDYALIIPAGTWHNLTNTGRIPLKLYSIYAPPNHPFGTVHLTQLESETAEH